MNNFSRRSKVTFLFFLLGIVTILFVYFLQNFQDQESFDISLLEENKTNSREEAIEIGQILGCTRVTDLGDTYLPCSSIREYNYALKLYNLKLEINSKKKANFIENTYISVLIIIVFSLLFYIFQQSKKHESLKVDSKNYLMPGEWVKTIDSLGATVTEASSSSLQTVANSDLVLEDFKYLKNIFLELQNKLNDQDKEIKRLRKGYDNHLVKKFINRFLRVHNYLVKQNQEFPEDLSLQNLLMLMDDALESSNVYLYNPEVGGDYRDVDGLAENPEIIETNEKNQDFKIKNIIKPGYFLKYEENKEFVQDAVVSIYSYVLEEE